MAFLGPSVQPPLPSSTSKINTPLKDLPNTPNIQPSPPQRIPRLNLDLDVIPDAMAAKLATSLLGHVLFLKNQTPFPVLQLSRLPSGKSNSKALKLRRDLIDSFDTLSSHLDTTFTSLSTAFARSSPVSNDTNRGTPAYVAILVGPSIGTAKSKVIFAVDGLETKIWGLRDDISSRDEAEEESEDDEPDTSFDDDEEEFDDSDDSEALEPEDSDSDSENDDEDGPPTSPLPRPPTPPTSNHIVPVIQDQLKQEQQNIRAADQLLSRTLATADAEGRGMACELAPTQTHILIRAPRRFSHPAWVPQPNFTNLMEHTLNDFLEETRNGFRGVDTTNTRKQKQKQSVEGVWITGKSASISESSMFSVPTSDLNGEEGDEADEMIWWSWDGKIVGFSSW